MVRREVDRWREMAAAHGDRRERESGGEEEKTAGGAVTAKGDCEAPKRSGKRGGYGGGRAEGAVDVIRKPSAGGGRARRGIMSCR